MDIRKFAVEETSTLTLRDANGDPMLAEDGQPMTITLYSPGSKTYAKAQAAQNNRLLDKLKRKGKAEQSASERAAEAAEFLSACTQAFSSNIQYDELTGEALYKAVYADTSIGFIAEQVGKHLGDWANFSKGSATS